MQAFDEPVILGAHPRSALIRRMFWWLIPLVICPMIASILVPYAQAAGWILLGLVVPAAVIVMPRLMPVRIELEPDGMRFGEGLAARRIAYDDVLLVDLRLTSEPDPESDEAREAISAALSNDDGLVRPVAVDGGSGGGSGELLAAMVTGLQADAEPWRVTVHASLIPISVTLAATDAKALARALHLMCPRAALWDVDGRLVEPQDHELAASSTARVKRMAVTRRVLSMLGGFMSLGAVGMSFGGGGILGLCIGNMAPFLWMGLGAGLLGMAAGAEKRLLNAAEPAADVDPRTDA